MSSLETLLHVDNMRDGYLELTENVTKRGRAVSPRGEPTYELPSVTIVLADPTDAVPVGVRPGLRLEIGAAETVQLLSGASDARQLTNITGAFHRFTRDDRLLGAYGPRALPQFEHVIKLLTEDEDTRRASLQIWRPTELQDEDNPDVPCTIAFDWMVRDGALDMFTVMRSNDLFLGVPYDFMMFTRLQLALAWALGVRPGKYTHHVFSLHVYERDLDKLVGLVIAPHDPVSTFAKVLSQRYLGERSTANAVGRWRRIRTFAQACVIDSTFARPSLLASLPDEVRWYYDILLPYRSGNRLCQACYYVLPPAYFKTKKTVCLRCISEGKTARSWAPRRRADLLTDLEYDDLMTHQASRCAICGDDNSAGRWGRLNVDHDHQTGRVRGLLCDGCNKILGLAWDDSRRLRAAASYLDEHAI